MTWLKENWLWFLLAIVAAFVGYEVRAPDADVWHAPTGALRPGDILRPLTW